MRSPRRQAAIRWVATGKTSNYDRWSRLPAHGIAGPVFGRSFRRQTRNQAVRLTFDPNKGRRHMTIRLHRGDLPDLSRYTSSVAIDTETMGLNPHRDRLCVVQMSNGDASADIVQVPKDHHEAPNLKALLANPNVVKIFHFA